MSSTVSVIIPAYNQSHYLGEAIRSVLSQTYSDYEVLVVDDGSTDDTRSVASSFGDPRVRYLYQDNRGLSAARNTGIRNARGSLLTFLDSDDLFLPEKLDLLVGALEADSRLGFVAGQAILIDELGEPLGEVFDRGLPRDNSELLLGNPLHVGSVLLRREWQEKVGQFDETLRSYEDWDLWLRLARAGCAMGWVPRPVSLYRFHRAQMTRLGGQMTTATFAVLDKTYREPSLPETWRSRRDEAYGRAFLRAAAQAYTAGDFTLGRNCLRDAVRLSPDLCAQDAEPLARLAAGWANHAKTSEPIRFLEGFYTHLPDELAALRRRRRQDLAKEAAHLAHGARARGDMPAARRRALQAIGYSPKLLLDRGLLSILTMSLTRKLKRFDPIVLPLRFVRETGRTWKRVTAQRESETRKYALLRDRERRTAAYLADTASPRKLQIGAGDNPLDGWLNTDLEPVADGVIFLDALTEFPFKSQVFDYVFSEHMIEHIPYKGGVFMLREAFRVMKPGGRIRIATPDAERLAGLLTGVDTEEQRRYVRWSATESLGLYAAQPSKLQQRRPEWAIDPRHIHKYFPDVDRDCACFIVNNFFRSYGHQFLYDRKTLSAALQEAGFVNVTEERPGRSSEPQLDGIDSHGRLIGDENNAFETLVLEAVRP